MPLRSGRNRRDFLGGAASTLAACAGLSTVALAEKGTDVMASNELDYRTADLSGLLAARKVSAVELLERAVARIEARDGKVNAVVVRDFDRARQAAKAADAALASGERKPLLGIPMTARPAGEHPFPPGTTLVCYTDGLVERRGETIDDSVGRLATILGELGDDLDAEVLADAILVRCVPNRDQTDDVALVVVTNTGPAA